MINNIFLEMERLEIVDWGVVYLGCQGLPIGRLSPNAVSEYACKQLVITESFDDSFVLISELSFCVEVDIEVVDMLSKLCELNKIDLMVSKKKWLVFSLKELMNNLPKDNLYGPLQLNNFWCEWGELDNSPNIIQGVDNIMTPNEFYSDENYKEILSNHNLWLKNELHNLGV